MAKYTFFIKQQFQSYLDVDTQIEQYEQSTGYRISVFDSKKSKDDNNFDYMYKVYKCVQSGAAKSKGKGIRNKMY